MIEFLEEDRNVPDVDSERFVCWISDVIVEEGRRLGNLTFVVGSDEWLLEYNKSYLKHDYYTDIITFDYCEGDVISGDLLISLDRTEENAIVNNVLRETEFLRVCVHGVLHLCGYGDKSEVEIGVMRAKEDSYLCKY